VLVLEHGVAGNVGGEAADSDPGHLEALGKVVILKFKICENFFVYRLILFCQSINLSIFLSINRYLLSVYFYCLIFYGFNFLFDFYLIL
jgi:hypothetical protein